MLSKHLFQTIIMVAVKVTFHWFVCAEFVSTRVTSMSFSTCMTICILNTFGPRREKTGLRGLHQSEFQTGVRSYRDYLEN